MVSHSLVSAKEQVMSSVDLADHCGTDSSAEHCTAEDFHFDCSAAHCNSTAAISHAFVNTINLSLYPPSELLEHYSSVNSYPPYIPPIAQHA